MSNLEQNKKSQLIKRKLMISGVLFGISALLFIMSSYITGFADVYYKYIYSNLIKSLSRGISFIPFSLYEIILYVFSIFILSRILLYIYLGFKRKISFKGFIIMSTTNFLVYVSVFTFLNMITLGVNSFKSDFVLLTGLNVEVKSQDKLVELCEYLKENLNELDRKIKKDEKGFLKTDSNVKEEGINSMKNLGRTYSSLQGFYPTPKPYIFSEVMSYQLLMGETDFTLEANYNNEMPESNIPSTICHELSHIKGFNNEYEANYISFLACINSDSYEYQYSGYLMAYSYCMGDLYDFDLESFKKINGELSDNVKKELKNDALYWDKYRGRISKIHNETYDKLLKITGQEEGIRSYNAVVKLLISGYGIQFK